MNTDYRIPRRALIYLFITQLLLLAPLMRYLPPWIIAVWFLCSAWQWRVNHQKARNPRKFVLLSVITLLMIAQGVTFKSNPLGLEPSVTLLLIATSLKMLEITSARDVFVVCFMGFLLAPVQFLFDQDMSTAAWIYFVCLPALLLTLFSLQSGDDIPLTLQFKSLLRLLALALPMMIVIFLVFPRMGPLWAVPLPGNESRTGLSDSISPGGIARLGKSTELAFRVKFEDKVPDASQLYWRAIVFERLQIDTWKPAEKYWRADKRYRKMTQLGSLDTDIAYEITTEPNYEHWLYALDVSKIEPSAASDVRTSSSLTFYRESPNMSAFAYKAKASVEGYFPFELEDAHRDVLLKTPKLFNPKTRELIEEWSTKYTEPETLIQHVLDFFSKDFKYTLEPPTLGRHSVDDFVFDTRLGFCEHFASAFAVMMRMAGIPARLVGGYHGGEINQNGNYLLVHQSDAHAWAEVWLENKGWVRVDPTAVVSPERISDGIARAIGDSDAYLSDSVFSLRKYDLLNDVRYWMDELEYDWQRWVIGYRDDRQMEVLQRLIGSTDIKNILTFIIVSFLIILGSFWLYIFYEQFKRRKPAIDRFYDKFCQKMAKAGYSKPHWQGPREFQHALQKHQQLNQQGIKDITDEYIRLRFVDSGQEQHSADFQRLVKEFSPVND